MYATLLFLTSSPSVGCIYFGQKQVKVSKYSVRLCFDLFQRTGLILFPRKGQKCERKLTVERFPSVTHLHVAKWNTIDTYISRTCSLVLYIYRIIYQPDISKYPVIKNIGRLHCILNYLTCVCNFVNQSKKLKAYWSCSLTYSLVNKYMNMYRYVIQWNKNIYRQTYCILNYPCYFSLNQSIKITHIFSNCIFSVTPKEIACFQKLQEILIHSALNIRGQCSNVQSRQLHKCLSKNTCSLIYHLSKDIALLD